MLAETDRGSYRILLEVEGSLRKICRILYGRDGSYFVTAPYHRGQGAALLKLTVNYAKSSMDVALDEAIETASIEDERRAVKLSHHPDGLVQFSGPGITSGRDAAGQPKGVAVESWPLDQPVAGPAFGLTIRGAREFEGADDAGRPGDVIFGPGDVSDVGEPRIHVLEGHYFPPLWRRFIRRGADGTKQASIVHPNGAVLTLVVLTPPASCHRDSFLAIELYTDYNEVPDPSHGFILSGSTGNLRRNSEGELLGDGIYCIAPRGQMPVQRAIDYGRPDTPPVVPASVMPPG
jgi:hypothetical protein